ncbi:uncharacterized protein LOC126907016 isoform X2 [Daktulosphaira vitifoliae]|uniref:uncharacterized protein LOC126907016 isoform X2 n=1 Tax=Daktulosphaira vitifoliae TaxID=58002 RepID=UPI0021AA4769|nr:uncharacterized protein LOC126907016 isoform X2 [Daktulosphaira vitifoliae]
MIYFTILTCLLVNLSAVSTSVKERHCNFSRYIFSYFIYCERYLLRFNKTVENISEEDLKKYGEAIQSHSDIILLMLAELYCLKSDYYARDLMAVNLYLNNVSGSVNIISINISNENTKENKILLLLEGYQKIHEHISAQLFHYIRNECNDEIVVSKFVVYPKIIDESCTLNMEQLILVTKDLENKITKEINTNSCTHNSKHLFYPKNIIHYDLFTYQPIENENNFMDGSQKRQIKANVAHDYLNLLRFTPLNIQCADGSNLTLSDAFRFIKFHFYHRHVASFQKLIRRFILYPCLVLLSKYYNLLISLTTSNINSWYYNKNICPLITPLANTVIEYLNKIKDLNILEETCYDLVSYCKKIIKQLLEVFDSNWPITNNNILINHFESLKYASFHKGIKLEREPTITITEDNFYFNYNSIIHYGNQVKNYIIQLVKHKDLIISQMHLHKQRKRGNIRQRKFLTDAVIDKLCKNDIYKTLNRTNDLDDIEEDLVNDDKFAELGFVKIETSLSSIQNVTSIDDKANELNNETTDASRYVLFYMVDYLMYTIPISTKNK